MKSRLVKKLKSRRYSAASMTPACVWRNASTARCTLSTCPGRGKRGADLAAGERRSARAARHSGRASRRHGRCARAQVVALPAVRSPSSAANLSARVLGLHHQLDRLRRRPRGRTDIIANPRSTASVLVARCHAAGPPSRSAAATYRLPLDSGGDLIP
eukprot:4871566-Prymnesium_polylepis.1